VVFVSVFLGIRSERVLRLLCNQSNLRGNLPYDTQNVVPQQNFKGLAVIF
jgi:hypothetical protein